MIPTNGRKSSRSWMSPASQRTRSPQHSLTPPGTKVEPSSCCLKTVQACLRGKKRAKRKKAKRLPVMRRMTGTTKTTTMLEDSRILVKKHEVSADHPGCVGVVAKVPKDQAVSLPKMVIRLYPQVVVEVAAATNPPVVEDEVVAAVAVAVSVV